MSYLNKAASRNVNNTKYRSLLHKASYTKPSTQSLLHKASYTKPPTQSLLHVHHSVEDSGELYYLTIDDYMYYSE